MKHLKQFLILCFLASTNFICIGQTNIMSFNIRYDTPRDKENWWEFRKEEVVGLLNYYQPDFIGIQEAMPNQSKFIAKNLASYKYIGHGRDGLNTYSEGIPLFYKEEKFRLLENELFWLSDTPKKASKGWDAALNRIVVYGVFKNKANGDTLHIFNCHFDHQGNIARKKSAELLVAFITEKGIADEKIILMGDLNCLPTEEPIRIIKQQMTDSFNYKTAYGPLGTFNEFDTEKVLTKRIDYIFTKNIEVKSYRTIDDRRKNNLYPSDHLPILIKIGS